MDINKIIDVVGKYLKRSNRNVSYLEYAETKIQEYLSWYRGKTDFHTYFLGIGRRRKKKMQRLGLDMAKTVCEDWASLLLNEKVKIQLQDEESQQFIDYVLEDNDFKIEANRLIELMCALGTGSFNNGIENGKHFIDYVHGDMIFPLSWENGQITECAFGTVGKEDTNVFFKLVIHEKNEIGNYEIKTVYLNTDSQTVRPQEMVAKARGKVGVEDYAEIVDTGTSIPMFHIIKPNIINNYDKTNPLGMSVYGNAIDILKSIDRTFDSLDKEFETGRRRLFVKSDLKLIEYDTKNKDLYNPIDRDDVTYHLIDWEKDDVPIHQFSPELRVEEHFNALNYNLKLLSKKVGLGDGFYKFDDSGVARTATEIVSVNSSLWRNVEKFKIIIQDALIWLVRSILNNENLFNGGSFDVMQDITIDFDDSIIEDSEKQEDRALKEYNAGIIDRVEYFVLTRKMTREQAKKLVAEMEATDTMKETFDFINSGGFD